ncbi:MAG: hypothetical protein WC528_00465 [Patescibacteria group bacterium]
MFDPKIYNKIPYDDLLVFALYSLIQRNKVTNFENLVVECYELFPQRFGLPGYISKYPDSSQVEKCWLRCRTDKGLITGSKAQGFEITGRGLNIVQKIRKVLGAHEIDTKKLLAIKGDRRTKSGRLVKQLEENSKYKEYLRVGNTIKISEFEFCDLIYCTLDSLPETRRKNLQQLFEAVEDYNRNDLVEFLKMCETRFSRLLNSPMELDKKYVGGMHRRKIKN